VNAVIGGVKIFNKISSQKYAKLDYDQRSHPSEKKDN
jgi:hypothetical protein